jgi:hypothetical protein
MDQGWIVYGSTVYGLVSCFMLALSGPRGDF